MLRARKRVVVGFAEDVAGKFDPFATMWVRRIHRRAQRRDCIIAARYCQEQQPRFKSSLFIPDRDESNASNPISAAGYPLRALDAAD